MILKHIYNFFRYNKHKNLTIMAYIYSFYYRIRVKYGKQTNLERLMGARGKESPSDVDIDSLYRASLIARHVNHVSIYMPWEEKCLVRALSLQRMLKKRNIPSTLYLGVKLDHNSMVAHAWLRCGELYLTGGKGEGYSIVERFAA